MSNEPTLEELPVRARRHHVRAWLGVSDRLFTKLVTAGVVVEHHFLGDLSTRAYFKRDELLAAERAGRIERAPPKARRAA